MTLRTKTFVITSGLIFLSTLVLYIISAQFWLDSISYIEEQNTQKDITRVTKAIEKTLKNLSATALDWGAWDETYRFVQDKNQEYIDENLIDETFENLGLNLFAYVTSDGEIVYQRVYDYINQKDMPIPEELNRYFDGNSLILGEVNSGKQLSGILSLNNELMLVATSPILPSDKQGHVRGGLIVGRYLNENQIADLSDITQVKVSVFSYEDALSKPEFRGFLPGLATLGGIKYLTQGEQSISGLTVLKDIEGNPTAILIVESPRQFYLYGKTSLSYLVAAFLIVGLLSGGVAIFNLNRTVLQRVQKLTRQIDRISETSDLSARLNQTGTDEMSHLANAFDRMLVSLEQSQTELAAARDELEQQAHTLSITNQALQTEIEERREIEALLQVTSKQQEKLIEIARYPAASLDMVEVLSRIGAGAKEILNTDGCAIYLLQEDGRTLQPVVAIEAGYEAEILSTTLDIDTSFTGQAVKARRGIIFNSAGEDENGYQIPGTPVEEEERILVAPFVVEGQVLGAMCLDRCTADFFQEELEIAETFAIYAGLALRNAQAHQLLQKEVEERRIAEKALSNSEERYRTLVNHVPLGLYRTSNDARILDGNPALMEMFGFPDRESMLNADITQLNTEPDGHIQQRTLIKKAEVIRGYDFKLKRLDGKEFWARDTFRAIRDDSGNVLYYEGSLEDVTEQKRGESIQKALFEISQAAHISENLDELYKTVHSVIGGLMPAKNFYIALHDEEKGIIWLPYHVDEFDEKPLPWKPGRGLTEYVIRKEIPVLVSPEEFNRLVDAGEAVSVGVPSLDWLGVPLITSNQKTIGAMVIQTYDEGVRFSEEDLGLITIISTQVAMAIERKGAEEELKRQRVFLSQVIDINPNFVFAKDRQGRYTLVNQAVASAYGVSVAELLGKTDADFNPNSSEVEFFQKADLEVIESQKEIIYPEEVMTDSTGKRRWLQTVKRPLMGVADDVQVLGVSTDITERKRAEEQLTHNAFHDLLTGLPNRLLFVDRLQQTLQRSKRRRSDHWFAVLFLDLDRFKTVNDTLGHVLGDQLLISAARRLSACLRTSDSIARFGGDEFVILLDDLDETSDATKIADRILSDMCVPFNLAGHDVVVTASIGIVFNSRAYEKPDELLRDADIAMYRAKALGRSRYVVFNSAMRAHVVEHMELEKDLRQAIENQELELHYQPILSIRSRQVDGFEALVRWRHPKKGLISPADFIPFAEETGLIIPLGEYVLKQACKQMNFWHKKYPTQTPLTVSVNLSNRQFSQPELFAQIENAMSDSGFDPHYLRLEITESVIMENADLAIATLNRLRTLGVQVHIDDFGTGYSSLVYLHMLPINAIKIDRSFISGNSNQGNGAEIVQSIVRLAHDLKIEAIAEGVETSDQLNLLSKLNCEYAQGYLISQVLESNAVENLLSSSLNNGVITIKEA